jgi:hypothetical protein
MYHRWFARGRKDRIADMAKLRKDKKTQDRPSQTEGGAPSAGLGFVATT